MGAPETQMPSTVPRWGLQVLRSFLNQVLLVPNEPRLQQQRHRGRLVPLGCPPERRLLGLAGLARAVEQPGLSKLEASLIWYYIDLRFLVHKVAPRWGSFCGGLKV